MTHISSPAEDILHRTVSKQSSEVRLFARSWTSCMRTTDWLPESISPTHGQDIVVCCMYVGTTRALPRPSTRFEFGS